MSSTKIRKLTEEQKALFPVYTDKWVKIGTCTRPTDRTKAEYWISRAYENVGLAPPRRYMWAPSPPGLLALVWNSVDNSVHASINYSINYSVDNSVWNSVWSSDWSSVRDSVGGSVHDSINNSIWNSVGIPVRDSIWNSVRSSVGRSVNNLINNSDRDSVRDPGRFPFTQKVIFGQHAASTYSVYDYYLTVLNLTCCEPMTPLMEVSKEVNWWMPTKEIVYMTEKPIRCLLDDNNLLHADGIKAIEYKDGFGVYSWHGVRLPENYGSVFSTSWKPEWVMTETNSELRRILIREIGYEKLLTTLEAKSIDVFREYELLQMLVPNSLVAYKLLKMTCPSTGKEHFLRTPPEIETAEQAITWCNWGINPTEFIIQH